jgi:hypothetical protein
MTVAESSSHALAGRPLRQTQRPGQPRGPARGSGTATGYSAALSTRSGRDEADGTLSLSGI